MKDIGAAAIYYELMKNDVRKAEAENENRPTLKAVNKEIMHRERLKAFEIGLEYAGILEEVKEEWSKRYGHD